MENSECEYTKLKEKINCIDNWFSTTGGEIKLGYQLYKNEWELIKKYIRKPTVLEIAEMKGSKLAERKYYGEKDVY